METLRPRQIAKMLSALCPSKLGDASFNPMPRASLPGALLMVIAAFFSVPDGLLTEYRHFVFLVPLVDGNVGVSFSRTVWVRLSILSEEKICPFAYSFGFGCCWAAV